MSRPHASDRQRGRDPMAITNRANRPMDMYRLKNCLKQNAEREFELEYAHRIINHSQMQFNHHTRKHHTFKPAFSHACIYHVHFIFITVN